MQLKLKLKPSAFILTLLVQLPSLCSSNADAGRDKPLSMSSRESSLNLNLKGDIQTYIIHDFMKKTVQLPCSEIDLSTYPKELRNRTPDSDLVQWYRTSPDQLNLHDTCQSIESDDDRDEDNEDDEDKMRLLKCAQIYTYAKDSDTLFHSTLRLRRLTKEDLGLYECRANGMVLRKFDLRGDFRVTRKSTLDGSTERSVFVTEGALLHLYCNYSLYEVDNYVSVDEIPNVTLSWFKDDEDITDSLRNKSFGLFQNFSEIQPNEHIGPAGSDHRGEYKCSVNLVNKDPLQVNDKQYPVEYKFFVRVRDPNRWMIPGSILILEVLGLAIFTAFIWKREESKQVEVLEDSDDDDEQPETPASNANSSKSIT